MTNEEVIKRLEKMRLEIDHMIADLKDGSTETKVVESDETKAANELFEKLWALYPRKDGKSAVSLAAKKRLLKVGEDAMIGAINAYKATVRDPKYTLMGSTFFNTRYQDYLGVEVETSPQAPKKPNIVYENGSARLEW